MKVNKIIDEGIPDKPDKPNNINKISDSEGLSRAYNAPNSVFIDGNQMFIAGTHTGKDVFDW